jgi:DNA repair protein RecN (Recombination protein N)
MLLFLRVRNFALIDQLEINLKSGLIVLSGETGAGKSLIIDALGLLTGAKASADMVRTGETRAVVEAIFQAHISGELDRLGLDTEGEEIVVRREISADERNRVYINNQPSTVAALREIAPLLLDIHGQHEQQTLLDSTSQLSLIDAFAETESDADQVCRLHIEAEQTHRDLTDLLADHTRKTERLDLLVFQRDEIQKTNPQPGETEQARERLEVLSHSGKLLEAANLGYHNLYESEASVLSILAQTQRSLRDASQHDVQLQPLVEQVEAARIGLQDIAYALRDYANQVDADPHELERIQARLAELERLHRKYGPDLLGHLDKVRREIDSIGLTETKKEDLERKLSAIHEQYERAALALSHRRRTATKRLESLIERELKTLAMPNARFRVAWGDVMPGRASGIDRPEFLISANPGEDPMALKTIASGGELSRIMLALRTVLTTDHARKTLVFDEVDAGIGGKAAETVGKKLQQLSSRYQILCVTHLAQMAAFADHQYRIEKVVQDGRTVTRVEVMTGDARVDELARMMSGSRVTDAARQHVRELMGLS